VGLSEGDFGRRKAGEGFGEASWVGTHTSNSLARGARSDVTVVWDGCGKRNDLRGWICRSHSLNVRTWH
jgi:hypothetical protein